MNNLTSETKPQTSPKATLIKVSVDVHAISYSVVRQVDNARMQPPQRIKPEEYVLWVAKQRLMAQRVVVCYESGPMGFVLARRLQDFRIECRLMIWMPWRSPAVWTATWRAIQKRWRWLRSLRWSRNASARKPANVSNCSRRASNWRL